MKLKIDMPLFVVYAAQVATIPLMWSALSHAKGIEGSLADHPVAVAFTGIGLALCGTAGNSLVVNAMMTMELRRGVKYFLGVVAGISFACMMFVVSTHLHAAYSAGADGRLGRRLDDTLGSWSIIWFLAVLAVAELQAPALMVVSALRRKAEAEEKKAATTARILESITDTGGALKPIDRTKAAVLARPGLSTKELAEAAGVSVTTIANSHGEKLTKLGIIHRRMTKEGATWWPGPAPPVAGEQTTL